MQADPGSFKLRDYLGTAYDSLATWYEARGQFPAALQQAVESQRIFAHLAARDPSNRRWSWKLELSEVKEAQLRLLRGETERVVSLLAPLAEGVAHRVAEEPGDRRWRLLGACVHISLGTALAEQGRSAEARRSAEQAVSWLEALHQAEPDDRDTTRWLAKALLLLGQIERHRGDAAAATVAWERAYRTLEPATRGTASMKLLEPWVTVLLLLQRRDEARPILATMRSRGYLPTEIADLCRKEKVEIPIRREP